jgi:hypothetical protein
MTVLGLAVCLCAPLPHLIAVGKATAAPATQTSFLYFGNDIFRCHFRKHLGQSLEPFDGKINLQFASDQSFRFAKHHTQLFFVKGRSSLSEQCFSSCPDDGTAVG